MRLKQLYSIAFLLQSFRIIIKKCDNHVQITNLSLNYDNFFKATRIG